MKDALNEVGGRSQFTDCRQTSLLNYEAKEKELTTA
jgi:hypothetical protein